MNQRVPILLRTVMAVVIITLSLMSASTASSAAINTATLAWSVQYMIDQSQTVLGNIQTTAPRDNRGLAISPDGKYLYAGYNNGPEVRKLDLSAVDYTAATVARTTVSRGKAIAVDDLGRVYLADGGAIKILDANLSTVLFSIGMTKCEGVAVQREGGTLALYATERGGVNTLTRWELTENGGAITGATKAGLDGDGVITIAGASDMRGVALDSAGRIWIADPSATTGNGKVFRMNSDGTGLVMNTSVPNPYAIALNGDEVLVTGGYQRLISLLDMENLSITQTLTPPWTDLQLDPEGNGSLGSLTGIVVTPGGIYVTNEAGQTADSKSTYGADDTYSGDLNGKHYTDLYADDNDPILKLTIVVPNQPPVADPGGPYLGAVATSILFDGTGSSDPDNNLLTYAWDFGDGNTGTGAAPTHSYTVAGIYDLCLTVNDGTGESVEVCTYVVVYDPAGGFVTGGGWIDSPAEQTKVAFNTIPEPLAGNYVSQPYQAQQTAEFGDQIKFAGTDRLLDSVIITMSSWACETGSWVDKNCVTTENSGYTHPLTLNIYGVDDSSGTPVPGALLATVTQDTFIPFRPSSDPSCTSNGGWGANCYNGYAFNVTFDMSALHLLLPDEIIYGLAFNTQTWGYNPIGVDGPYTSLNFALVRPGIDSREPVGIDVDPDAVFWNTETAGYYADNGAAGVGIFRQDTGWAGYVPAARFYVTSPGAYKADPSIGGKATFGFVSKYKKGAAVPDGNTEFKFVAGDLNFSSMSYQWLVVNQAGTNAQFKGVGTINGTGEYGFMLWAADGSPDTFRIKIWEVGTEVVVYDNGTDQPIGGGSIVVHKK